MNRIHFTNSKKYMRKKLLEQELRIFEIVEENNKLELRNEKLEKKIDRLEKQIEALRGSTTKGNTKGGRSIKSSKKTRQNAK